MLHSIYCFGKSDSTYRKPVAVPDTCDKSTASPILSRARSTFWCSFFLLFSIRKINFYLQLGVTQQILCLMAGDNNVSNRRCRSKKTESAELARSGIVMRRRVGRRIRRSIRTPNGRVRQRRQNDADVFRMCVWPPWVSEHRWRWKVCRSKIFYFHPTSEKWWL